MARPGPNGRCTICRHAERARIELLMARGASRKAVGEKFAVSPSAAMRHWREHVPTHVKAAAIAKVLKPGETVQKLLDDENVGLLENLQRIRGTLYLQFDAAAEVGDRAGVATLATRLHENLRMAALKTGELQQHASTSVTNIVLSADYLRLRGLLLSTLRAYPEASQAVASAFRQIEDRSGLTGNQVIEHAA
jgi:hypothetical protein